MTLYIGRWKLEAHGQSAAYLWSQNVQTGSGEICWWDDTKIFKNSLITLILVPSVTEPVQCFWQWIPSEHNWIFADRFNRFRVASWKGTKDHNGSQWIITMILYDIIWYDSIWHVYDTLWYYIYTINTFKQIFTNYIQTYIKYIQRITKLVAVAALRGW